MRTVLKICHHLHHLNLLLWFPDTFCLLVLWLLFQFLSLQFFLSNISCDFSTVSLQRFRSRAEVLPSVWRQKVCKWFQKDILFKHITLLKMFCSKREKSQSGFIQIFLCPDAVLSSSEGVLTPLVLEPPHLKGGKQNLVFTRCDF